MTPYTLEFPSFLKLKNYRARSQIGLSGKFKNSKLVQLVEFVMYSQVW